MATVIRVEPYSPDENVYVKTPEGELSTGFGPSVVANDEVILIALTPFSAVDVVLSGRPPEVEGAERLWSGFLRTRGILMLSDGLDRPFATWKSQSRSYVEVWCREGDDGIDGAWVVSPDLSVFDEPERP